MSKELPKPKESQAKALEKQAFALADFMYGLLDEFPEDEKWVTSQKLRISANDLLYYTAQAIGNITPSGTEYEWANASKHGTALRTLYIFAARQKFIDLDPNIVVKLDKLLQEINHQSQLVKKRITAANEKEHKLWREKYKQWKAMNNEG